MKKQKKPTLKRQDSHFKEKKQAVPRGKANKFEEIAIYKDMASFRASALGNESRQRFSVHKTQPLKKTNGNFNNNFALMILIYPHRSFTNLHLFLTVDFNPHRSFTNLHLFLTDDFNLSASFLYKSAPFSH